MADGTIDAGQLGAVIGAPATPPTAAEVEIAGKKYVVAPALAEALKAENAARQRELAEARAAAKPAPAASAAPATKPSIADRIFTDPDAVLAEHEAAITAKVTKDLETKYAVAEQRKVFWSKFFTEHDDLKGDQEAVEFIMGRHYDELAALPVAEQNGRLADLTRKMLGNNAKVPGAGKTVTVEAGGHATTGSPTPPATEAPPEGGNVASITQLLRNRRDQRHEARKQARST